METTVLGVTEMTVRQLDFIAYNHIGIVGHLNTSQNLNRGLLPDSLPGGWTCRWVGTHSRLDEGTLVLLPADERTRDIVYFATLDRAKAAGLPFDIAKRIAKVKTRFKYEIIDQIIAVMSMPDTAATTALMYLTEETDYDDWYQTWHDVLPTEIVGYDRAKMVSLAFVIRYASQPTASAA